MLVYDSVLKLFTDLQVIKRKYPIVKTYLKYISEKLPEDDENFMKLFLLKNTKLCERVLDDPVFKPKNIQYPIDFTSITTNEDVADSFWENITQVDRLTFPNGRPETKIDTSNPIISELLEDLVPDIDGEEFMDFNIAKILTRPDVKNKIEKMIQKVQAGKINKSDLISILKNLVPQVTGQLNSGAAQNLNRLLKVIENIESGNADPSELIKLFSLYKP